MTPEQKQYLEDTKIIYYVEGALWAMRQCLGLYKDGELEEKLIELHDKVKTHMDARRDIFNGR